MLSDIADCDISDIYDISDCVCDKALSGGKWKREQGVPKKVLSIEIILLL